MSEREIIAAVREVAAELTYRGARPGCIEPGTRGRLGGSLRLLVDWHNKERTPVVELYSFEIDGAVQSHTQTKRADPPKAVILRAMISQLVRVHGSEIMRRHSPQENEQAISTAAAALPILCDRLEAMAKAEHLPEVSQEDADDNDIEAKALDCLTTPQRKTVESLLKKKHSTTVETMKSVPGAFQYGESSTDRAVTAQVERINKTWLENGIPWTIDTKSAKDSPRFKLEK